MNELLQFTDVCELMFQKSEENQEKKNPTFKIVAYTGVPMYPWGFSTPVVIELGGVQQLNELVPIRMNHDSSRGVGHATKVYVEDGKLVAEGIVSRATDDARDVVESAKNGYPWQISVGGRPLSVKEYAEGETFQANGQTFEGPAYYIPEFELCEMSFCDLGADHNTSAEISATLNQGILKMTSEDKEILDASVDENIVEASQDTTEQPEADVVLEPIEAQSEEVENVEATAEEPEVQEIVEETETVVEATATPTPIVNNYYYNERNANRIAAINSIDATGFEELKAQAIDEGWSLADFNTALTAARHDANLANACEIPKVNKMKNEIDSNVVEASIVLSTLGESVAQKYYNERELNAADDIRRKLQCFRDVFSCVTNRTFYRDDLNNIQEVQAAFTTSSLEKIFRNVVNKALLTGYETVGDAWRKLVSVSRASDFKPIYNYRVGGDFTYKEIDQDGEITNAKFSEEEYSNIVKTYALKFSLTRAMLYNDDLNALVQLPTRLGEGAAQTLNDIVFQLLLSNPTGADSYKFFSANHANYAASTSAVDVSLSIASLGQATTLFELQETPDGRPIAQEAKYLVVPTSLKVKAMNIMNSTTVNETTNIYDPQGVINPFAGKYEIVATPYLQSSRFTNASNANWYLFGDPNRISAIDVVFLNGVERPTIQQGDVSFDRLGIQYRGVFDFGVALQNYRGAVMMEADAQ